jgi:hypothetical protein
MAIDSLSTARLARKQLALASILLTKSLIIDLHQRKYIFNPTIFNAMQASSPSATSTIQHRQQCLNFNAPKSEESIPFAIRFALMELEEQLIACEAGHTSFDLLHQRLTHISQQLENWFQTKNRKMVA